MKNPAQNALDLPEKSSQHDQSLEIIKLTR